jgi:Domain of Unknown Function with PDB structure (DUF3857)/Transglutaminase-like superfamily
MLRSLIFIVFALTAVCSWAEERVIQRGEYRFTISSAPDFVVVNQIAEKWPDDAPGAKDARWRNWLLDSQTDYRQGQAIMFTDHAYEALSAELVGEVAKQQIYFNPEYQTLSIHAVELRRNGVWSNRLNPEKITLARRESDFESDMSDGMVSALIVLDDVRVGDVVRLTYTVKGLNPVIKGVDHDQTNFAWIDPVLNRKLSALYDPNATISHRSFDGAPEVVIKKNSEALVVTAQAKAVAGTRQEGGYPRWYRPFPVVMLAEQRSWADVVKWAKPLYPDPGALPKELEAKMQDWQAITDPEKRLMAVLQTMQEDIRYFGIELGESSHRPHSPAETWQRRFGDCKDKAYLMSVVLSRMGIPAVPALATTRYGKGVRDFLPAATAFNHVIVQVQLGKQTLWVDPTLTQQRGPAKAIETMDYGYVLPIAEGVSDLRQVIRAPDSMRKISVFEKYTPSVDGKIIGLVVTTQYSGGAADNMRRELVSRGRDEIGKSYSEFYRKRFGQLDIAAPFSVNDDQANNALTFIETYHLKEAWDEKTGNTKSLSVYADSMDLDTKLPDTIDRKAPLSLNYPMHYLHEQTLELPQGWSWLSSSQNMAIKANAFNYEQAMGQTGQTVAIKHQIRFEQDHVNTAQLNDYLSKMRDVRDGMSRRFVLSMPNTDKDRDARLKNILRDVIKN